MSRQLALWDESEALNRISAKDHPSYLSRAEQAMEIAARLVTIDMQLGEGTIDECEHAEALDQLVSRASNLFVIGRDDEFFPELVSEATA